MVDFNIANYLSCHHEITIDYGTKRGRGKRPAYKNNADKIKKMLKSEDFQCFCEVQGVEDKSLLQITVAQENISYELDNCDSYLEGYRIVQEGQKTPFLVKSGKFIHRTGLGERPIYHSEMYWVWKANGRWWAEQLLADDGWLDRKNVEQAFRKLAEEREYTLLSKVSLYETGCNQQRFCWKVEAVTKEGEKRELFCCLDNGGIRDLPAGELPCKLKVVEEGRMLKTKFNHFYYELGKLRRAR